MHCVDYSDDIPSLVAQLESTDPATALEALVSFRKMLSKEDNPPIADVIAAGVGGPLPDMIRIMHGATSDIHVPSHISDCQPSVKLS